MENLIDWGHQKRSNLALRRIEKQEENIYSFAPSINSKSKRLAQNRGGQVEIRLLEYASVNTEKLQQLQRKMSEQFFRPQISDRSRSLAKGK